MNGWADLLRKRIKMKRFLRVLLTVGIILIAFGSNKAYASDGFDFQKKGG